MIIGATMDVLDHGRVEPGELLEENWFFGNLLHGKSRIMLRSSCHFDPDEKSMEETYSSIKKIQESGKSSLTRAGPGQMKTTTSIPPNVENIKESSSATRINSMKQQMQCGHLLRAPSLPTFVEEDEFQDEESEFSMGKLIRQASLNHAKVHQPPFPTVKRSCSISYTIQKQSEAEKIRGCDEYKEKVIIRRAIKSCGRPPTPLQNGTDAKKSAQDMKAQIKFWARAVASNVRQE